MGGQTGLSAGRLNNGGRLKRFVQTASVPPAALKPAAGYVLESALSRTQMFDIPIHFMPSEIFSDGLVIEET
ncbi:hypothetical protein [Neisseria chenwenguii]|uniref:Uncharacterized protein n=1 Tax=Neisseria chenwenguii TaxID=1853278 RepID=A0A220S285_9NEIS|nr:hypothetical protein [Neisseria chenwenguii]ASK27305.1 hypothetical protein BG910_05745 [Neisseria chenwenguii]ROV57019.1 hypothetical protein EGS38_02415 [Neisseria chenwenguii]